MRLRWIAALLLLGPGTGVAAALPITEFPAPTPATSRPDITVGPDGAMWFTKQFSNKIGRVTTAGVVTEFPIVTNSSTTGIATGADGNLWITEDAKIARMTPTGGVSEFDSPAGAGLGFITPGPDGNIWYTHPFGNKIGRITPGDTPVVQEFSVLTANSRPQDITTGPDGALWFTESVANKIGRATTAASPGITEMAVPTANAGAYRITSGPDGALWFTELIANKIGRVTTSGTFTEFPLPTANAGLREIAVGSDGALWFTEADADRIGRITVAGAITEFPLSAGAEPGGIVGGPDGALWFSEAAHFIGRIPPSAPPEIAGAPIQALNEVSAQAPGTVNPNGAATSVIAEYGTTTNYGSTSAPQNADGFFEVAVTASLPALQPGTLYHYRLVATSAKGTSTTPDQTFTTPDHDTDGDGAASAVDCNDNNAGIRPGATDVPGDGIDQDCSGADAPALDADGDGVPAGRDCNDADATIKPGAVEIPGNTVDENCDSVATPFTTLSAALAGRFDSRKRYSTVKSIKVSGAPVGASVVVTCRAPKHPKPAAQSCAFQTKTLKVSREGQKLKFGALFDERRLAVGTVITLKVTAPDSIGKSETFTIAKRRVKRNASCLSPAGKPTRC